MTIILNTKYKNIAEEILDQTPNAIEAMKVAEEYASDTDQNWNNETTIFTFSDNSKLKFCGSEKPTIIS